MARTGLFEVDRSTRLEAWIGFWRPVRVPVFACVTAIRGGSSCVESQMLRRGKNVFWLEESQEFDGVIPLLPVLVQEFWDSF